MGGGVQGALQRRQRWLVDVAGRDQGKARARGRPGEGAKAADQVRLQPADVGPGHRVDRRDVGVAGRDGADARQMRSSDGDRSEERLSACERGHRGAQEVHAAAGSLVVQGQPRALHARQALRPLLRPNDHHARVERAAASLGAVARRGHQPHAPAELLDEWIAAGLGEQQARIGPDLAHRALPVERLGQIA